MTAFTQGSACWLQWLPVSKILLAYPELYNREVSPGVGKSSLGRPWRVFSSQLLGCTYHLPGTMTRT